MASKAEPVKINMDVSKMVINRLSDLEDEWELFVSMTDTLPDTLIMSQSQLSFYISEARKRHDRFGWPLNKKFLAHPTYKGLEIKINDKTLHA